MKHTHCIFTRTLSALCAAVIVCTLAVVPAHADTADTLLNFGDLEGAHKVVVPNVVSESVTIPTSPTFADVKNSSWYYQYVEEAAARGWVNGVGSGQFAPEKNLSVAEWTTMLTRVFIPDKVAKEPSGKAWYSPYMNAAEKAGLFQYCTFEGNLSSAANKQIARYDMAMMVMNLVTGYFHRVPTGVDNGPCQGDVWSIFGYPNISYSDVTYQKIDKSAQANIEKFKAAIYCCSELGIINGTGGRNFSPNLNMTRAQAATVLCRVPGALTNESLYSKEFEALRYTGNPKDTLSNGKAITEANVKELLDYLPKSYTFPFAMVGYKTNPGNNPLPQNVTGCGTFANRCSDYLFGGQKFTGWTTDTSKMHAGDMVYDYDKSGTLKHVWICAGKDSDGNTIGYDGRQKTSGSKDGSGCFCVHFFRSGYTYKIATRYPASSLDSSWTKC